MPTNALTTTSRPPDSQTERLAREWAVTFAELYSVSLKDRGPRFVTLWVSALVDIPTAVLDAACYKAMKACRFFPTPAEIRAFIDDAGEAAQTIEAETAWEFAFEYAQRHYHPDLGVYRSAPGLPAKTEHAIRAAGGLHWLWGCPEDQISWTRKRFLEAYANISTLEQNQGLLPEGSEARRFIRQLSAVAVPQPRPQLTPVTGRTSGLNADGSVLEDLRALRVQLGSPEEPRVLSVEDYEARRAEIARQKKALELRFGSGTNPDSAPAVSL